MSKLIQAQGIFSNSDLILSAGNVNSFLFDINNFGLNSKIDFGTDSPTMAGGNSTKTFNIKPINASGYPELNLQVDSVDAFNIHAETNDIFIKENRNLSLSFNIGFNNKKFTINSNGALGIGSSPNYGNANQVLVSQGPTAAPTWTTLDNNAIAASAGIVYSKLSLTNSIVNADINSSASISDTKLATISTAGKVSNSATTATATAGTANSIVLRDGNGYVFTNYFNSTDNIDNGTTNSITYIMAKFGDNYFRSATAAKVAAFLSGQSMDISGNATTAGGLAVHAGRNNETNRIVRTDANGYLQAGYINSSYNNAYASFPGRLWGTNGSDNYLRTYSVIEYTKKFQSTSHVGTYWLTADHTTYPDWITIISNHGNGIRVGYANSVGSASAPTAGSVIFDHLSNSNTHSSNTYRRFLKSWAVITGTTPSIAASSNVSSLTDAGTSTNHRYYTLNTIDSIPTNSIVIGVGPKSDQGYDCVYNGTSVGSSSYSAGLVSASAIQTGPQHTPAVNAVLCLGVV